MNTIRSTWIGWGTLCVAGGGAYYFAKRSINADRAARHEADMKRRRVQEAMEYSERMARQSPQSSTKPLATKAQGYKDSDHAGNPSGEASDDPAPTRHSPEDNSSRVQEKSKYEATEVFRSRKGDRFS